jgi:hypothetical protein
MVAGVGQGPVPPSPHVDCLIHPHHPPGRNLHNGIDHITITLLLLFQHECSTMQQFSICVYGGVGALKGRWGGGGVSGLIL